MELGFRVESAQSKREQDDRDDVPVHVPMAPRNGERRNPSTDQKKVRRQLTKKAISEAQVKRMVRDARHHASDAPASVLTARYATVANLRTTAAYASVDAAWGTIIKLQRDWGTSRYSMKITGNGMGSAVAHVRHSDGSEFFLISDRWGNTEQADVDGEVIPGNFASVDAVKGVLTQLTDGWGDYGYSVTVVGDGSLGAIAEVRHSDGSEFTLRGDRYGMATTAAKTAAMGDEDDDIFDSDGFETCPACGGVGNRMGQLGSRVWYRCRDCGMTFDGRAKTAARYVQDPARSGWSVGYTNERPGFRLDVFRVSNGGVDKHPKWDGRMFDTMAEAEAFAASVGLLTLSTNDSDSMRAKMLATLNSTDLRSAITRRAESIL